MKYLIITLVVSLLSCGPQKERNFLHINILDTDERIIEVIAQTAKDINLATRCEIFGPNHTGKRRQLLIKEVNDPKETKGGLAAFDPDTDEIAFLALLRIEEYEKYLHLIFLHELGHALGLKHVEGTVMGKELNINLNYSEQLPVFSDLLTEHNLNPCDLDTIYILPPTE
jgi:hypothetical protein